MRTAGMQARAMRPWTARRRRSLAQANFGMAAMTCSFRSTLWHATLDGRGYFSNNVYIVFGFLPLSHMSFVTSATGPERLLRRRPRHHGRCLPRHRDQPCPRRLRPPAGAERPGTARHHPRHCSWLQPPLIPSPTAVACLAYPAPWTLGLPTWASGKRAEQAAPDRRMGTSFPCSSDYRPTPRWESYRRVVWPSRLLRTVSAADLCRSSLRR